MSLAILGLGTALPACTIDQEQSIGIARVLCLDPRQAPLVPVLYRQTEIARRHIVLSDAIVSDVVNGTRHTESVWLPRGVPDDCGPTTSQRMGQYVAEAAP
ncbi:MAG: hypothetical protein JNM56_35680, partial [Planctomycetia bacterium]|nr:hypothetical protein [Planctomycetia bacterium]